MGFIGILILSIVLGTFCITAAAECVPETAKCSKYWERMLPHKDLMSTEEELNSWCRKQELFFECLEDVLLEGKNGNLSYLPVNLLISKLFVKDHCLDESKSRQRLLENAHCINQLNTDFCILPEYLDIVTPDEDIPSTRCSQAEKTFSCVAATMVLNCGFDAARVYRAMLKITRYSDEVCGIEVSEGIPPCEGSRAKAAERDKKLSDIYYGLFDRIGDLLDTDENELHNSVSEKEQSQCVDEVAVNEAIRNAIDRLDENVSELEDLVRGSPLDSPLTCLKGSNYKPYMKNPIVTEVFPGTLFYNYSGMEYAVYWRQPEFNAIDKVHCEHPESFTGVKIFKCRIDHRHKDPNCVYNSTVHEKVTPEFIKSFDPEVPCDSVVEYGTLSDWMKKVDRTYVDKTIRSQIQPESSEASDVFTTSSTLLSLVAAASSRDFNVEKWYEFGSQVNSLSPNGMQSMFYEILRPGTSSERPPMQRIKVGDSIFIIMYDWEESKLVQNVTCSRLDECHQRGKGLWKCKIWPRKIETCDTCEATESSVVFESTRPSESMETITAQDTTEPTVPVESDVLKDFTPLEEPILVFSDADPEKELIVDHSESETENELDSMSDETSDELEDTDNIFIPQMDTHESEIKMIRAFDKDGDSESPEVIYAIEGSDVEDGDSVMIATEDGLLAGNVILLNVSDLDETKYSVISAPIAYSA